MMAPAVEVLRGDVEVYHVRPTTPMSVISAPAARALDEAPAISGDDSAHVAADGDPLGAPPR